MIDTAILCQVKFYVLHVYDMFKEKNTFLLDLG